MRLSHVNNFININKTNNLSLTFTHWTLKKDNVGNLGLELGQAQKCGWVKPVNVIPALPSW
jgi:hypothetical protein